MSSCSMSSPASFSLIHRPSHPSPSPSLKNINMDDHNHQLHSSKRRPKKNAKKARKGLIYLKLNLKDSVSSGLINPINKMQLSILNTGLIKINDEVSRASGIIPKKPFDLSKNKFDQHIDLFNQYKVLLDIEYHVCFISFQPSLRLLHVYFCVLISNRYSFYTDGLQERKSYFASGS
jgi:hypothetical protein